MKLNEFKKVLPTLAKAEIVPLIIGESGVGKTESVRQVANDLGYRFINIRLGQLSDAGDLTGLPEFTEVNGVKVTSFMQPDFFPKKGERAVVFFDEINRCHPDLIQAVFQAVERNGGIGEYKFDFTVNELGLPNTIRAAASNPPTEDYTVHDITDKAFRNRFCHIKFEPNAQEALDYFREIGVKNNIPSFLTEQPTMLEVEGQRYDLNYVKPTRRNWEAVNRFLELNDNPELTREVLFGLVGSTATFAFEAHVKNREVALSAKDVLDNFEEIKDKVDPERLDILNVVNSEMIEIIKLKEMTETRVNNMFAYCNLIPLDLAASFFQQIIAFDLKDGTHSHDEVNKEYLDLLFENEEFLKYPRFKGLLRVEDE